MVISLTFAFLNAHAESGSDEESKTHELAKGSQNPVANLSQRPFPEQL